MADKAYLSAYDLSMNLYLLNWCTANNLDWRIIFHNLARALWSFCEQGWLDGLEQVSWEGVGVQGGCVGWYVLHNVIVPKSISASSL